MPYKLIVRALSSFFSSCSGKVTSKARSQLPFMSMLLYDGFSDLLLHPFIHAMNPTRDMPMINIQLSSRPRAQKGRSGDISISAWIQISPMALVVFPLFAIGERFKCLVNSTVYSDSMTQVQLRLSQKTLEEIDRWVAEGRFKSRSDAIKTIISLYEEREKTREFFRMLVTRSEEAKKHPEALIPLEES